MTSVNSDDLPTSQSPGTQRSKSGSKSTSSRPVQELSAGYGYNGVNGEGTSTSIPHSDDQSRSAYIQELQRTIDALRAQQVSLRDHYAQSRRSHFSGEGDEHQPSAHSGEERIQSGQMDIGEGTERGWKLEIQTLEKGEQSQRLFRHL